MKDLENIKNQKKALKACLQSGTQKAGYMAVGVSRSTWDRFLSNHPEFSVTVHDAIEKGKFLRKLKYSASLSTMAVKLAYQKFQDGTASDRLIIAFLPLTLITGEDEL